MRVLVVFLLASLVGCAAELDDVSETGSTVIIDNRLSANRLSANRLSANRLSANRLSANRLSANRLELDVVAAEGLLETAEGREVLSFIISCAIPDGQTLEATHDGTTYEFFGELGLAPRWAHRPLDRKGKGWVSACLFSRVNAANVAIPVSLRGRHSQLTATADERANWTFEEGAFYGNYFTPADEPIDWIACRGRDQAAGEIGGLVERDCAEPDPANPELTLCGFKYAGDCGDFAPEPVCKRFHVNGTYYMDCASSPKKKHHKNDDDDKDHWKSKRYRQVITTFVIP